MELTQDDKDFAANVLYLAERASTYAKFNEIVRVWNEADEDTK